MTVTVLLVANTPTRWLAESAADEMTGTRVTRELGGSEIATVTRCWVDVRGLHGDIEFDDPAVEAAISTSPLCLNKPPVDTGGDHG